MFWCFCSHLKAELENEHENSSESNSQNQNIASESSDPPPPSYSSSNSHQDQRNQLSSLTRQRRRLEEAKDIYFQILENDSSDINAYLRLASISNKVKNYEAAKIAYQQVCLELCQCSLCFQSFLTNHSRTNSLFIIFKKFVVSWVSDKSK